MVKLDLKALNVPLLDLPFSYYGRLTFDDDVIIKLIRNGLKRFLVLMPHQTSLSKKATKGQNGLIVDMSVVIEQGHPVKPLMQQVQNLYAMKLNILPACLLSGCLLKLKILLKQNVRLLKICRS